MIEILEKGFLTLPVTSKRHAFASLGVPAGGPMDSFRYDLANSLVGNSADAPALEATLILPGIGLGVDGVFWAEMISQLVGASCCFITMYRVIWREMRKA